MHLTYSHILTVLSPEVRNEIPWEGNKRPIKCKCVTLTILCTGSKWNDVICNLEWVTIKQARVLKGDHQTSQKLVQKLVWIGEFLDGDLPLITAYWTSAIIEGRLRGLSQVIRTNPCQGLPSALGAVRSLVALLSTLRTWPS